MIDATDRRPPAHPGGGPFRPGDVACLIALGALALAWLARMALDLHRP